MAAGRTRAPVPSMERYARFGSSDGHGPDEQRMSQQGRLVTGGQTELLQMPPHAQRLVDIALDVDLTAEMRFGQAQRLARQYPSAELCRIAEDQRELRRSLPDRDRVAVPEAHVHPAAIIPE